MTAVSREEGGKKKKKWKGKEVLHQEGSYPQMEKKKKKKPKDRQLSAIYNM